MNTERLLKNITDQVTEAHLKLGYVKETIRLYYPLSSLNSYLGTDFSSLAEAAAALTDSCKEGLAHFGMAAPVRFLPRKERLEVLLDAGLVEAIHQKADREPFLEDLISLFQLEHHPSRKQVTDIFLKYSGQFILEDVPEETGFDYSVHFEDPSVDEYYYCFKEEMGHLIYHRFMKEDYEALF